MRAKRYGLPAPNAPVWCGCNEDRIGLLVDHRWLWNGYRCRSQLNLGRLQRIEEPDTCRLFIACPSLRGIVGRDVRLRSRTRKALELSSRRSHVCRVRDLAVDHYLLGNPALYRLNLRNSSRRGYRCGLRDFLRHRSRRGRNGGSPRRRFCVDRRHQLDVQTGFDGQHDVRPALGSCQKLQECCRRK